MRGKRLKSAVHATYKQRVWQKAEDEHWRDLGHHVGLHDDDDEAERARVLARGPRNRRPTAQQAPSHTPEDWARLLNLHMLPRQAPTPQIQQPPGTQTTAAAYGGTAGTQPQPPTAGQESPGQSQVQQATVGGRPVASTKYLAN